MRESRFDNAKLLLFLVALIDAIMIGGLTFALTQTNPAITTLPGGVKVESHQLGPNITALTDPGHPLTAGYTQTTRNLILAFTLPRTPSDMGIGQPWVQIDFKNSTALLTPTMIYVNGSAVPFIYPGVNIIGGYAFGWWPGNFTSILVFTGPGTYLIVMSKP